MKGDLDWDPKPDERTYYRSGQDGQRAYLVKRAGKDMLRLDRPMEELLRPLRYADGSLDPSWQPDQRAYAFTEYQVSQVAYEAHRALCRLMGKYTEAEKEWLSMKEQARIKWMEEGPNSGDIRDDLHDAIMGTLRQATDG